MFASSKKFRDLILRIERAGVEFWIDLSGGKCAKETILFTREISHFRIVYEKSTILIDLGPVLVVFGMFRTLSV